MADLTEFEHVPWIKLNDYLREIGGVKTRDQFYQRVVSGLHRLIPSDVVGIFQVFGPCLYQFGADEKTISYYEYYQFRLPWFDNSKPSPPPPGILGKINWRTIPYRDSEFVTDFIFPMGYTNSLTATLPEVRLGTAMHRSSLTLDFSDLEYAIMNVLVPHIQNFYNCFDKIAKLSHSCPTEEEIVEHFSSLSHREVEIAALLCQGLTFSEIATCLFISRRTVETHIENLYKKLSVHDKRTAIERLTGCE